MHDEQNASLESIRRGIWAVLGVLLLMLGFNHTPIAKSEAGEVIAMLGFAAGILILAVTFGSLVFRFLSRLKKLADDEQKG